MKVITMTPKKHAPKDNGKPFEHTKSPALQKVKRFLSKAIIAVVR